MKYEVVFLAEAEGDLNNLFDYIADQSGAVRAQTYVARIEAACSKLASFPNRGAPRPDLLPGLRTLSFEGRALIAYRIENRRVAIVRVFYGGRDYERELTNQ
jgi:toxin ParE1/3/4